MKAVECIKTEKRLEADHGIVASFPYDFFGYFGWPTVARTEEGRLIVAASGFRNDHICPFGRTVMCTSSDDGITWTPPAVVNDFPIDDRDAGVCCPEAHTILVSWFSSDTRISLPSEELEEWEDPGKRDLYRAGLSRITDACAADRAGNWIRVSRDGGTLWEEPVRVPLTAPHGPIVTSDGRLFFLGKGHLKELGDTTQVGAGIGAMVSVADYTSWDALGTVPFAHGADGTNYFEPHVVEFERGRFLGLIRIQDWKKQGGLQKAGITSFSMAQTRSDDGGVTWSKAEPLNFHGSPPHVFRHSSGVLICVYGYRREPYGERVMLSYNDGDTWHYHFILRDDGPDIDLGYPSSVELSDGSILSVYYQKISSSDEKPSLLRSRWSLP